MSILTIPQELYDRIYTDAVVSLINSGFDLVTAKGEAKEQMANAYRIDEVALSTETEKDLADERNSDWTR